MIHPGGENVNRRTGYRGRRRRFTGKHKQHGGVIQKVARPRDGKLLRTRDFESDRLPVAHRTNPKPPRFNVHALIPEAGLARSNGYGHWAGNVEIDEVVAGCGMSHIHGLVIYRDGKS